MLTKMIVYGSGPHGAVILQTGWTARLEKSRNTQGLDAEPHVWHCWRHETPGDVTA